MSEPTIPLLRTPKRWFTPAEANELLPELVALVTSLAEGVERAREVGSLLEGTTDAQNRWAVTQDLNELQEANRELFEALGEHGVELKGLGPALLDFPALREGREVYLCWRQGETAVTHWHPLHTGVAGRQAIEPGSDPSWDYWS